VHARDEERQRELDRRLIPFIPSWYQAIYLVGLVGGFIGWSVASDWFSGVWPQEERSEYGSAIGYRAAQGARLLALLLVFLPLAGIPAVIVWTLQQFWTLVTLPARAVRWLSTRSEARTG
jgi:hypothetical protein